MEIKENYSTAGWSAREEYYIKKIGEIGSLPTQPDTREVLRIQSQIDDLLSEAMIEHAIVNKKHSLFETTLKVAEKQLYNLCRDELMGEGLKKPTSDEIKSAVAKMLKEKPIDNLPKPIYDLIRVYSGRYIFIDSVVKLLKERKASLMITTSMIKIEANIGPNGFTNEQDYSQSTIENYTDNTEDF